MPRPKLHHIGPNALLRRIVDCYQSDVGRLKATLANAEALIARRQELDGETYHRAYGDAWDCKRELEPLERDGIPYDLPRFADRPLTPSLRILFQTEIRKLEAAGLVSILGNKASFIKPTAKGLAKITENTGNDAQSAQ